MMALCELPLYVFLSCYAEEVFFLFGPSVTAATVRVSDVEKAREVLQRIVFVLDT